MFAKIQLAKLNPVCKQSVQQCNMKRTHDIFHMMIFQHQCEQHQPHFCISLENFPKVFLDDFTFQHLPASRK